MCCTEFTASRADVAQNHERGCTPAPALPLVGTLAAAADGVQAMLPDNVVHFGVSFAGREFDFEPIGFYLNMYLVIDFRHSSIIIFPIDTKVAIISKRRRMSGGKKRRKIVDGLCSVLKR